MTMRAVIGLLALLAVGGPARAAGAVGGHHAADFLASEITPPLVLQDVEVTEAITTLMQRYDVPVRLTADDIAGIVAGNITGVTVSDWLSQLGRIYNFYWYFDGALLEIGKTTNISLKTLSIDPAAVDAFLSDLDEVGVELASFPVEVNRRTGTVIVRGPESLQKTVTQIAASARVEPEPVPVARPVPVERPVRIIYGRQPISYGEQLAAPQSGSRQP